MLYYIEFTNEPCRNEEHLEYTSSYINRKAIFRECPRLDGDACRCCDYCNDECFERFLNSLVIEECDE